MIVEIGYKIGPKNTLHRQHLLVGVSPLQQLNVQENSSRNPGNIMIPMVATAHHISLLVMKWYTVNPSKTLSMIGRSISKKMTLNTNTPILIVALQHPYFEFVLFLITTNILL